MSMLLAACSGDTPAGSPEPDEGAADAAHVADPDEPDLPEAPDAAGDTLTIRLVQDIANLDPAILPATVDDAVLMTVAEGLVTFKPGTTEVVNQLAKTFEASEDGLRYDFELKEGIQFHGGYGEVTAEDVKYSFERIAGLTDPPIESTYVDDWAALEGVEVTGTYTGTIILNEQFAPLMVTTLPGHAGLVLSKAAVEELGEDFATAPIGTGPYEFTSWSPRSEVVVTRFADYGGASSDFADPPQWERIVFAAIEDDSAADIALETGAVDFGQVSHAAVSRFEANEAFEVTKLTTADYGWVGMNVTDPVLSDVNVRRAVRAAIDVDSILAAGFENRVTRANALISPEMAVGHWADAPVVERDVDAARGYLAEAGVDTLTLDMSIREEPGSRAVAEIVQANLAEVGITVNINLLESATYREEATAGDNQLFYQSFSNSADPSWATVWFTCDQVGDWNYMSWCNEDFDALHEAALVEQDPDARSAMYIQMQEIMDEEAVAAWVMYRTHYYAYTKGLEPSIMSARYGKYAAWDFRSR
jgi:peptide/nickel transport system substrate-binding protein